MNLLLLMPDKRREVERLCLGRGGEGVRRVQASANEGVLRKRDVFLHGNHEDGKTKMVKS